MSSASKQHLELTDGVGMCAVPMWCAGAPAGLCDRPAYGQQEPGQTRYGDFDWARRRFIPGYCGGLACYAHGGPKERKDSPDAR